MTGTDPSHHYSPSIRYRLEPDGFTSLTDGQLDRSSNDPALGGSPGLALPDKESAIRAKPVTAFMAVETFVVPLSADGGDHHVLLHGLLAAQTFRSSTARIALETPCKAVFFHKWGLRIEWLYWEESLLVMENGKLDRNLHHHIRRRRNDQRAILLHRLQPPRPRWVSCNSCISD